MPTLKQHHLWRWASLAAVITFLAICLILLGSFVAAAQGPSPHPSAPDPVDIIQGNNPPASYPWEQSTPDTGALRSIEQDDFDLVSGHLEHARLRPARRRLCLWHLLSQ